MSKFCSFFAFGPRSVTTNLVPAEPFVSGPTWFHLSAVGGGFRKPVLLPPAMPSFGLQSLRTAPSLPRKTTLGRQVTFRGCALRCSTVKWLSSPPRVGGESSCRCPKGDGDCIWPYLRAPAGRS